MSKNRRDFLKQSALSASSFPILAALASAGQVLVSSTVKDLVIGSGLAFTHHGEQELKGAPGRW